MNIRLVFKVVGRVLLVEAATLTVPLLVSLIYGEPLVPFLLSMGIAGIIGFPLSCLRTNQHFLAREGFFTVALIWLITGLVGALPFWFCGYFPSFVDCIFESCSGFSTTGATILVEIESLPRGILFWRSFSHWLGGMGVLVLATAVVPSLGISSYYLTQAESPGPVFSKLVPRQSQTAKILYGMYLALTAVQTILLKLAGMPWYDAFIHAFSTAGTGGFSNRNASVGAYDSLVIDLIISVFMLLFSLNFSVYFLMLSRRFRDILSSDELRFFLLLVTGSTGLITINLFSSYPNLVQAFRYALFQVSSIISTTGFATTDWLFWPQFSQYILIILMFCGACAGSTGGGMKCSRILVFLRCLRREVHQILHPRCVEVIKLDGKVVEERTVRTILAFIGSYLFVILVAGLVISLDGYSFEISFVCALTCVSNVGPALGIAGPAGHFSAFSDLSKLVMAFCMIVGRLEIVPMLVLLTPSTWRRT